MRILHILIVLGGFFGAFMVYKDYAKQEKKRRNIHAEQVRLLIADTVKSGTLKGDEDFTRTPEAPLFRCLALLRQSEEDGYSPSDTALTASTGTGVRSGAAKVMADRINENYALAKKLGVFDELSNVLRMERGLAPIAHAKGWEDQQLTVSHILSPVVAPEAAHSLANLVLVPEIIRDMQSDDIGAFSFELSKKWLVDGLIAPETHQEIVAILERKAKKGL